MRKLLHNYLRKNKSIENVLESMDEHIATILIACSILTFILCIRKPFIGYSYDSLRYIDPANYEFFQPFAIAIATTLWWRGAIKKWFWGFIGWMIVTAMLMVVIDKSMYTLRRLFENLGYMLLVLSAYIILVFFGLLLMQWIYSKTRTVRKRNVFQTVK
jgi:hypothetical protein